MLEDLLKKLLHYDPDTGVFIWREGTKNEYKIAGKIQKGYRRISINGQTFRASHLAWLYMTGELPPKGKIIDHKNRVPHDNTWTNLRLANQQQNTLNRGLNRNNKSGYKGVTQDGDKWRAQIKSKGKSYWLGNYDKKEDAALAYAIAAMQLHKDFACLG